uniref:Uncharacterized protein n=1 Tax=Chondria sp. (in: red algae) TaxID=1982705 RepID=A0A1Z1MQC1_9FLOR|nr:hypothetical protein [Chondria sp. (in: red algae)]
MISLNNIYSNQYIYSPITKYHIINSHLKIYIAYNTMFTILYLGINKTISIILTVFLTIIYSIFNRSAKFLLFDITINNGFYLLHTFFFSCLIDYEQIKIKDTLISKLIIPCNLQINSNNYIFKLEYYNILYCIPKYAIKLTYIYIIHYNLNHILFVFTQSQIILESLVHKLNKISIFVKIAYNKHITNLYLGYQSLENIINTWVNNSIGQQIKAKNIIHYKKINILIILIKYYNYTLSRESSNSFILWNRNLFYKNFISIKYDSLNSNLV